MCLKLNEVFSTFFIFRTAAHEILITLNSWNFQPKLVKALSYTSVTDGGDSAVLDDEKIDALMLATVKSSVGKHADGGPLGGVEHTGRYPLM